MNNALYNFERPKNEPVLSYAPGSPERLCLKDELDRQMAQVVDIPLVIGGKEIRTGKTQKVVMPHDHQHVLGHCHLAGEAEVKMAIDAALAAREIWANFSWLDRTTIMLKAADLIRRKYRPRINAATMLGQSKSAHQAEIDSACEVIDFLTFNSYFCSKIYRDQPLSEMENLNMLEYRPLEGFVFTVSPFNFTAIAANLNVSPVLMGNTVVWKPASTSLLSNYYLMKIFEEAGLPAGVINFVPGSGSLIGNIVLEHPMLAGIHFTGSTGTFNHLWRKVGENLNKYRSYPKMVGETGGKDFIFVHSSADYESVGTAIIRGAFEYQGQKCSAASRGYIPESMWPDLKSMLQRELSQVKPGNVTDFSNFMNAVIDQASFDNIVRYIEHAREAGNAEIIVGGGYDSSVGYFVEPTVIQTTDPHFLSMEEEIFGPVFTLLVYPDDQFEEYLNVCDQTSPYALTGAIFATDRQAINKAHDVLRFAAGNFYINDKPTGAVVGQQPFGGARASGTNDKAGSMLNLTRWTSPRIIKETFLPPKVYTYPFMREK
ncbi:MAG: L-glutamate gamma-semialdehyde dehydrogenase [Bacteroidales bacterium]|nr:L-glutamate gamma-semialdehyde dehydrogenase [Bacteroidales bacterium]MDD3663837.1 L-glutamate gamma-semialdehyde dehydrogenase [Bacteroidales bacterium]